VRDGLLDRRFSVRRHAEGVVALAGGEAAARK
jgi:hypothetical protein